MQLYKTLPKPRERRDYTLPIGRGVELEVGDFLYGLVRLLKPKKCIETGTLVGDSAVAIARALRDNCGGSLETCDIEPTLEAECRLAWLPAKITKCRGTELIMKSGPLDFAYIDSGNPAVRLEELALLGDHNITPGGCVCWHDACVAYQDMYASFSRRVDWPHLVLPSVVGFAVFIRPE
jgi:predicted O-methyltransferase YrrM